MPLQITRPESVSLRKHPEFSEAWLHDRICDDTSILGSGDLDVIDRERVQYAGGRLDMLLWQERADRDGYQWCSRHWGEGRWLRWPGAGHDDR